MHIIISNYSKRSLALIQWAAERSLPEVTVCYVDTGWSAQGWLEFVSAAERFCRGRGFRVRRLASRVTFADLMDIKRGFPSRKHQWCSLHLKGITLLQWLDEIDADCRATLLLARGAGGESFEKQVPEFVEESEYHGGRRVWHPLFDTDDSELERLFSATGLTLPAGCSECAPCINSSAAELCRLSEEDIRRIEELEEELGVPMFTVGDAAESGIRAVIHRAREQNPDDERRPFKYGCSAEFGCGS